MEVDPPSFKCEIESLKASALDNKVHFEKSSHESDKKIVEAFLVILENLEEMESLYEYLEKKAPEYDLSEEEPGNGYRTMVKIAFLVVKANKNLSNEFQAVRNSMFFRRESYLSKIISYSQGLKSIRVFLKLCENLISWSEPKSLFTHEHSAFELLSSEEGINQYPFYSHLQGFQAGSSWYSGSKYPSPYLIFHCHGGGFISQSPRSHETYLRQWALEIDCPIVSLDYSLAPEAPFPRAVQEAFFAYCWILQNLPLLGSTGERIVLAGDSAGANINFSLLQQCREYGVRPPDGAFFAYVPVLIDFLPTPSRLLSLIDPLLPLGFLIGCIKAYACSPEVFQKSLENEYKLRPYKTADDTPINCNGNEDAPMILNECSKSEDPGIWSRLCATVSSTLGVFTQQPVDQSMEEMLAEMKREEHMPCFEEQMKFDVPQNPLLSPFLASEETLKEFPPIALLTTDMDPFLDDCVELAKRLKKCGNKVRLDVLPGLSHGFLNFVMVSKEASEGSKKCASIIKELLYSDLCRAEDVLVEENPTVIS